MILIVDTLPDYPQHVHDGQDSKINDNKDPIVDELDVQVKRD